MGTFQRDRARLEYALETREQIGTRDLLCILRTWATDIATPHGDMEEFSALADRISSQPLSGFFQLGKP